MKKWEKNNLSEKRSMERLKKYLHECVRNCGRHLSLTKKIY